jgi:hypothetical protein
MVNSYGLGPKVVDFFQKTKFESFEELCFSSPNLINFAKLGGGGVGMANFSISKIGKKKRKKTLAKSPKFDKSGTLGMSYGIKCGAIGNTLETYWQFGEHIGNINF